MKNMVNDEIGCELQTFVNTMSLFRHASTVPKAVVERVAQQAKAILGDNRCSTGESVRTLHGTDLTYHKPALPDIVCFPHTTEEVSKIVSLCNENNVPIIPYGVGTALEGHFLAIHGGMTIDLSQMNQIIEFYPQDLNITVQAGVTREQVNEYVREQGLFFPIDPGANATIGGMTSTRASGTNAVRYGTMRENVVNLKAVLPNGNILTTSKRAKKSSAGYDLTRLLIGSEGTLGVITEITLKLYGVPEAISAAVCTFPDVTSAAQTVSTIIQYGIPIARVELMDETCVRAVNQYSKLGLKEQATLFFEFHGTNSSVEEQSMVSTVYRSCLMM
jgi:D-lactate dehydrogenase (cytochrome)